MFNNASTNYRGIIQHILKVQDRKKLLGTALLSNNSSLDVSNPTLEYLLPLNVLFSLKVPSTNNDDAFPATSPSYLWGVIYFISFYLDSSFGGRFQEFHVFGASNERME